MTHCNLTSRRKYFERKKNGIEEERAAKIKFEGRAEKEESINGEKQRRFMQAGKERLNKIRNGNEKRGGKRRWGGYKKSEKRF